MKTSRSVRRPAPPRDQTAAAPTLDPALRFLQVLWQLQHGVQKISKRMERTVGVTGPQRLVLRVVGSTPGLTAGDIATTLHLHPSTVTGLLRRLEAAGVVARETDEADLRRVRLTLTAKGRRLNRQTAGTIEQAVRTLIARSDPAQVESATAVIDALGGALLAMVGEPSAAPRRRRGGHTREG